MCPTGTTTTTLRRSTAAGGPDFRPAFEVIDADRDGKISKDDLRAFYDGFSDTGSSSKGFSGTGSSGKGFSGTGSSDDDIIGSMMLVADSNSDGYVEYEEFERVLEQRSRNGSGSSGSGVMEDVFRVMDRDGDGRVGHEDLRSFLKWAGFGEASDEDIKAMITLGGGDENQGVTFEGLLKILAL